MRRIQTASGYSLPVAIRLLTHAELPRLSYPFRGASLHELACLCSTTASLLLGADARTPVACHCTDRAFLRAAAELIDALPSYCEATTRIYQTYALLRAQSKVCCSWSLLPAALQHLSDSVEGSSPAGQMDPDKSLIQVVLIRSLHKGQTDNSGGD